jgi:electron transfer flavoprotein alpha subunit
MADDIGVLVYSDVPEVAHELIAKGRELLDKTGGALAAVSAGTEAGGDAAAHLFHFGADVVYAVSDNKLENFIVEHYTDALEAVISQANPKVVIIGQTKRGGELAPRLAARLKTGSAVGCTKLEVNDAGNLVSERVVLGGNATAVEEFLKAPAIATIAPKMCECQLPDESKSGEVISVDAQITEVAKAVSVSEAAETGECKIEDAQVIVSGGRGFKKKEDFAMLEDLAGVLSGEIGCSRPIAADLKWMSEDHWVGLSGHKVKPKIYIACGISGQIQHLAGMRDADMIIAINKDREAPIFNAVDYGIVGDIYQVIPKLTEELKKG